MSNEIGKRHGRLVVIEKTDKRYHSTTIYKCRCDCGNIVELTINKQHPCVYFYNSSTKLTPYVGVAKLLRGLQKINKGSQVHHNRLVLPH